MMRSAVGVRIVSRGHGLIVGLGLGAVLGLACNTSAFQCSDDAECGTDGTCQPGSGYCSFPDEGCPSEQRYGEHAGDGLAGECVAAGGTGSSGGSSSSDPGTTGVDPDDGADSTTGIEVECDEGSDCAPLPPEGWEGPLVALLGTGSAPPCPEEAPEERIVALSGLSAPEHECGCECSPSDCNIELQAALGGGCGEELPIPLSPGDCQELSVEMIPPEMTISGSAVGCTPSGSADIPPVQWTDEVRLCGGASPSCSGGSCVPSPGLGAGTCIYREGEHTCPLSGYTQAYAFYLGLEDGRDCTSCSCGDGGTCQISAYDGASCDGMPFFESVLNVRTCNVISEILPEGVTTASIEVELAGGACEASGGDAFGEVLPLGPLTLCCRP